MWKRIVIFVVLAGALLGVLLYSQKRLRSAPEKVSGFVESYDIRVGSRVGGRISRVMVREGDRVQAGAGLVELEPFDLKERLAEAQANLQSKQAELARLQNGFRPEEIAGAPGEAGSAQGGAGEAAGGAAAAGDRRVAGAAGSCANRSGAGAAEL